MSYGLSDVRDEELLGELEGGPQVPAVGDYRPGIGLVGAGGISEYHLRAYQALGLQVRAICDRNRGKAHERAEAFFPEAKVTDRLEEVLGDDEIEVVDLATPAGVRSLQVEQCLNAGRHVLSQKPFVMDLDEGERLVDLAEARGLQLAVNQNGRWSPHHQFLIESARSRRFGEWSSYDAAMQFDHSWTCGTPYDEMDHLMLFDFGIHWFDLGVALNDQRAFDRVYAQQTRSGYQRNRTAMMASVLAQSEGREFRLSLHGDTQLGQRDETTLCCEQATIRCSGPGLNEQRVEVIEADGRRRVPISGNWFENGFKGTMAELLNAIGGGRVPTNHARFNLQSLAFCFAAIQSVASGRAEIPGEVRKLRSL
jgi:predicted dehydrogenase